MLADLHVHSTASDGSVTPAGLVALALDRGVDVLALADHDSVEGIGEALEAAEGTDLVVVPAVELSAVRGDRDVHILAYFVDHTSPELLAHLAELRESRLRRAATMVKLLSEAGYDIDLESVLAFSDGGAVGRSHVARALVSGGHADTVADAFARLIGRGKPFHVLKDSHPPAQVLRRVVDAGAVSVLAHPAVSNAADLVPGLARLGLRGVEAYHSDHTPGQRDSLAALAKRLGLLVTGGSDYHGPGAPTPDLGQVRIPEAAVRALLAAGGSAWAARL
jgi:predicted metal-dependent phosphoesterase TrpH